jgi:general secretion pathway protein F
VGTIVADGIDAAIDALYGSGLTPFETYGTSDEAAGQSSQTPTARNKTNVSIWKRELFESNRFSLKELAAFTVELASLTNSGLPLDAAFRIIAGPGASLKTVRLANGLLKDVLAGSQLSEAMARRPEIFPSDYRAILSAGEAGGVTGKVLKQIADLLARRLEIRNKISSALIYPIILILMSLVSVVVIISVLVPSISPIFTDAGLPLPGILKTFADLQENWVRSALVLGFASITSVALWGKAKHNFKMMLGIDRLKCSLPVVGRLIQVSEAGGFARALGTLLSAGVSLL